MNARRTPAIGPENGRPRSGSGGGGVDRQRVVVLAGGDRQHGDDDLHLVAQAVDERRAQRTVDQTADQDRLGGGRPSRRKNEPGIFRRRTSAPRRRPSARKKSKPSRGCLPALVADRAWSRRRGRPDEPCACWARRPVSKRMVRVPKRPLSRTASVAVISGPSRGLSFFV